MFKKILFILVVFNSVHCYARDSDDESSGGRTPAAKTGLPVNDSSEIEEAIDENDKHQILVWIKAANSTCALVDFSELKKAVEKFTESDGKLFIEMYDSRVASPASFHDADSNISYFLDSTLDHNEIKAIITRALKKVSESH